MSDKDPYRTWKETSRMIKPTWHRVPTRQGYYWMYEWGNKTIKAMFAIYRHNKKLWASDGILMWDLNEFGNVVWYGPINPPEIPKPSDLESGHAAPPSAEETK